jgi:hypothetical protein
MQKGIFCIEGNWEDDLRKRSTVEPILQLLEINEKIPYIHRNCATVNELIFYLKDWQKAKYVNYQILYLAFHGEQNAIKLHRATYKLDAMADDLKGNCSNSAIVFGSCNVLNQDERYLKSFLNKTKAYAVFGYKSTVDWMESTAFELLLLSVLQNNVFDGRANAEFNESLNKLSKRFAELDFRFIINK